MMKNRKGFWMRPNTITLDEYDYKRCIVFCAINGISLKTFLSNAIDGELNASEFNMPVINPEKWTLQGVKNQLITERKKQVKKRRENKVLDVKQKILEIKRSDPGISARAISTKLDCSRSIVRKILKESRIIIIEFGGENYGK